MSEEIPHVRMETRFDGIPEMTDAERAWHASRASTAPEPAPEPVAEATPDSTDGLGVIGVLLTGDEQTALQALEPGAPLDQIATAVVIRVLGRNCDEPDPALIEQLVEWGGMTPEAARAALLKGALNVV